jgi:hypothetical protein
MKSIGFPEILVIGLVPIAVYGVPIYCGLEILWASIQNQ